MRVLAVSRKSRDTHPQRRLRRSRPATENPVLTPPLFSWFTESTLQLMYHLLTEQFALLALEAFVNGLSIISALGCFRLHPIKWSLFRVSSVGVIKNSLLRLRNRVMEKKTEYILRRTPLTSPPLALPWSHDASVVSREMGLLVDDFEQ